MNAGALSCKGFLSAKGIGVGGDRGVIRLCSNYTPQPDHYFLNMHFQSLYWQLSGH